MCKISKYDLICWVREFNNGILDYELHDSLSKQDLVDYIDYHLTKLIKKYDLDINSFDDLEEENSSNKSKKCMI